MPYRITGDGTLERHMAQVAGQARHTTPLINRVGQWLAREARRRAPVGKGRFRGALRHTLNCQPVSPTVTALQSPLPYAVIQQYGGTITAGTGPLGRKLLAVPVHPAAQAIYGELGASTSLRDVPGLRLVKTAAGKLLLVREAALTRSGRKKRAKKGAAPPVANTTMILFVLVPRVNVPAQPYAPRVEEPQVQAAVARLVHEHLHGRR